MSYAQYGLTATNASSADHDKGIVAAPDGSFYQIEGFKRNKKDGLDTDAGKAFDGTLQADAAKGGWNPTTFNTATDVENALKHLDAPKSESKIEPKKYEPSDKIKQAVERVENFEKNDYDIYHTGKDGDKTAQSYLERYKMNLRNKEAGRRPVATEIAEIKEQKIEGTEAVN